MSIFDTFQTLSDQQLRDRQTQYRQAITHAEANGVGQMADSARMALDVIEEIVASREFDAAQQQAAKANKKKATDTNVLYTFGDIADDSKDDFDFKW